MKQTEMVTPADVEHWIYASYMAARGNLTETLDEQVRRPQLTRHILDQLGSPDRQGHNVIVTGSKGKGSTSVMLANILKQHGWRVGLFTSPHLVHFTERIRVNGDVIEDEAFVRLGRRVKVATTPITEALKPDEYVGPVGLAAVIAAMYFQERKTDVNIWECGRGALCDDVNQVFHEHAIITPIMEEHLTYLGPELRDVVRHKLGAITPSVRYIYFGKQKERVEREIRELAGNWQGQETVWVGRDVRVSDVHSGIEGTQFSVQTPYGRYDKLNVSLIGTFQADNAALALTSAEKIVHFFIANQGQRTQTSLTESKVRTALNNVHWPGRLELISQEPAIIIDGAIHRQSAQYVADVLSQLKQKKGILIIGIPRDKDYAGVLGKLAPLAHKVIVTAANRDYLKFPKDAVHVAKSFCPRVESEERAVSAFQLGLNQLQPDEWMAIVGTQSLVGEAQKFFKE